MITHYLTPVPSVSSARAAFCIGIESSYFVFLDNTLPCTCTQCIICQSGILHWHRKQSFNFSSSYITLPPVPSVSSASVAFCICIASSHLMLPDDTLPYTCTQWILCQSGILRWHRKQSFNNSWWYITLHLYPVYSLPERHSAFASQAVI